MKTVDQEFEVFIFHEGIGLAYVGFVERAAEFFCALQRTLCLAKFPGMREHGSAAL